MLGLKSRLQGTSTFAILATADRNAPVVRLRGLVWPFDCSPRPPWRVFANTKRATAGAGYGYTLVNLPLLATSFRGWLWGTNLLWFNIYLRANSA